MPDAVTRIEDAIESISGVERWSKGNSETIPALRKEGFDFDSNASILLIHRLAAYGDAESVRAALEAGAPAIGRIEQRCYPTELALLNEPQPLISAARRNQDEMLRDLLSHGAGKNQFALGRALLDAAENGSPENVHLLWASMDPDTIKSIRNDFLLSASASGNPQLVSEVLKLHPGINTQNILGVSPLYMALLRGLDHRSDAEVEEVVRMLLAAGADPNLEDCEGNTALFLADFHPAIARILIAAGANIEKASGPFKTRPLAEMRDVETTRVLLEAGADRNATDAKGQTALQIAIKRKQTDKADLLRNWQPDAKSTISVQKP
jgi:ankyrin repeat protein